MTSLRDSPFGRPPLRISLLGRVQIAHGGAPDEVRTTRRIQALLAYLVLDGRRAHPRDVLVDLFWSESSAARARGSLNTALWRLRRALEPTGVARGTYLLTSASGDVGFNWESEHWIDARAFEEKVRDALDGGGVGVEDAAAGALERALDLYEGDLLEGFYEDWALRERERLRCLYLDGLAFLMRHHRRRGALDHSLAFGERILRHDPLREEIHRELMRLHLECGERARALRQYETCRARLAAELAVPPMEETQALYERIVQSGEALARGGPAPAPSLEGALRQLRSALARFEQARAELQTAIPLVARLGAPSPRDD